MSSSTTTPNGTPASTKPQSAPANGSPIHAATPQGASNAGHTRQQEVAADAAKLLEMAKQLRVEIERTPKDQLSVAVLRRAAEIEKLARELKETAKQP